MKSKYQRDWDRGESFVFVGKGLHKELVPVKYVVARNKTTGDKIDYRVWKEMSSADQDCYELVTHDWAGLSRLSWSLTTELEEMSWVAILVTHLEKITIFRSFYDDDAELFHLDCQNKINSKIILASQKFNFYFITI